MPQDATELLETLRTALTNINRAAEARIRKASPAAPRFRVIRPSGRSVSTLRSSAIGSAGR